MQTSASGRGGRLTMLRAAAQAAWRARESLKSPASVAVPRIGLALGGGFARGIAHVGVLKVFEQEKIPIHCIAGVSAGAMAGAAFAGGAGVAHIERLARSMRLRDVARWTVSLMGLAASERMTPFLERLLPVTRFEDLKIPLAVVATDLSSGRPAVFRDRGDAILPIRASCSFPGLFQPVKHNGHCLVDGYIPMPMPVAPVHRMGATHVVSIHLPGPGEVDPRNLFAVVNRCFQIMGAQGEGQWRQSSHVVIEPKVDHLEWDSFSGASEMLAAGEEAARGALPRIREWFHGFAKAKR